MSADEKPPKEVFALATPRQMLCKLGWEIDQFKRALDALNAQESYAFAAACYCAFNCAVTALHCADWAWSSASESTRETLAKDFNFTRKADDQKDPTAFCAAIEHKNRDFFACRRIANGSKHMFLRKPGHPIAAQIIYSATTENLEQPIYTVDFIIRDGDESSSALDVFQRMFEFWRGVFERVGFIRLDDPLVVPAIVSSRKSN
jgi:hypothetical protein